MVAIPIIAIANTADCPLFKNLECPNIKASPSNLQAIKDF
jgi:hypothetical protein